MAILRVARSTIEGFVDSQTFVCRSVVRDLSSRNYGTQVLDGMTRTCPKCKATLYRSESDSMCCGRGKVKLPALPSLPPQLFALWSDPSYRLNIRKYNQAMAFCSLGVNVDHELANQRDGVYTFRVNGQVHHVIGPAEPNQGEQPKFAQIYFFDRESQAQRRQSVFPDLDQQILGLLHDVLYGTNPFIHLYQKAHELPPDVDYRIAFKSTGVDPRRYNAPVADDVGCILTDNNVEASGRDVIVRKIEGGLMNISEMHSAYDPLMYVLLLPYGSPGWHDSIAQATGSRRITIMMFYRYYLMVRDIHNYPHAHPLHLGGRLFQQFCVDQYAKLETNNLRYIRTNQSSLRAESYLIAMDALADGSSRIGRRIVLPSTFIGGTRHMNQCYQDSMAIVRTFGKADLFVTMTCNPKWEEISRELLPDQQPADRPDIVARVFNCKLKALLHSITKNSIFGRCTAFVYTVEFQKGVSHMRTVCFGSRPKTSPNLQTTLTASLQQRSQIM